MFFFDYLKEIREPPAEAGGFLRRVLGLLNIFPAAFELLLDRGHGGVFHLGEGEAVRLEGAVAAKTGVGVV